MAAEDHGEHTATPLLATGSAMGQNSSSEAGGETTVGDDIDNFWADLEHWAKNIGTSGEQTLDKVALGPGSTWQPDEHADECNMCDSEFSVFRRRHHCRHCGLLFCADCCDNFVTLNENSVRFKLRICEECNADADTTVNIREGAGRALESIMKHASAVGKQGEEDDDGNTELELHSNADISRAMGLEEGEELTVQLGGVDSALVILPDEFAPYDYAKEDDDADGTGGGEWWEESYFDGEFSNARGVGYTTVRDMPTADQERFLAYSDHAPQRNIFASPTSASTSTTAGGGAGAEELGADGGYASMAASMGAASGMTSSEFGVGTGTGAGIGMGSMGGMGGMGGQPQAEEDEEEFEGLE